MYLKKDPKSNIATRHAKSNNTHEEEKALRILQTDSSIVVRKEGQLSKLINSILEKWSLRTQRTNASIKNVYVK